MIPFNNLVHHHQPLCQSYANALKRIMASGAFILGSQVGVFESRFARLVGSKYCIGVSNGTDALTIALKALKIGTGDEVIIPAFTFVSTAFAVVAAGARPVLVDIEPTTLTIDPQKVLQALTQKTKAIIPVHLYGMPADMTTIMRIAKTYHLAVIEDAAQAHGSLYKNKPAGSIGDIGCFSFYPSKNIGALGDAGAVTTNSPALDKRLRNLINLGTSGKYIHTSVGSNNRLDTIQAAFLTLQLPHLDSYNRKRRHLSETYTRLLAHAPITLPSLRSRCTSNMHLYVIRTKKRDALQRYLTSRSIETGIHYPRALHEQPALKYLRLLHGQFPESERAAKEVLSLPLYPELTRKQIRIVCNTIRSFFRNEKISHPHSVS